MADLPKRQNDFSQFECSSCSVQNCFYIVLPIVFIFYCPFPSKTWNSGTSNNRNRNLENLEAAAVSSHHVRQRFFVLVDLCFLNPMFSSLFRIIVDIIMIASRVYCPLTGLDSFRKRIRN